MSKATFKKIVVMTVPGDATPDSLKQSLQDLLAKVEDKSVTDILVDVSELSKDDAKMKKVGEETGSWARTEIDPKLFQRDVKRIAFVSSSGNYHGREEGPSPLLKTGAPAKDYFADRCSAVTWLLS